MRAPQTSNPFDLVRATIEAELAAPGVLAVTSALSGDGKTGIAAGLARSLAGAGYKTLAIDAAGAAPGAVGVEAAAALPGESARRTSAGCDVLSILPAEARIASALAIATLYEAVRAHYDFAIVDAAVFTDGGLAFARGADGVVLALREGRAVAAADRDAVDLFERLRVRVLGVVATRGDRSRGTGVAPSLVDRLHAQPRSVPTVSANTVRAAGLARLFSRSPV
jgi:succinoglycan biosynthesis transport protein ExoP